MENVQIKIDKQLRLLERYAFEHSNISVYTKYVSARMPTGEIENARLLSFQHKDEKVENGGLV